MTNTKISGSKLPTGLELLLTTLLVLSVNFLSWQFQIQISHNEGQGMDGVEYYQMADAIANGQSPSARAPFVYRVGTPLLVATLFPYNIMNGFLYVNIISGSLIPFALLFWISLYYRKRILRMLPVLLFSLTWHSPLRLSWFYPVHSDPLSLLLLVVLLIIMYHLFSNENNSKLKFNLLVLFIITTILGVLVREICLVPALLYFLANIQISKRDSVPEYNSGNIKKQSSSKFIQNYRNFFRQFQRYLPKIQIFNKLSFIPVILGIVALLSIRLFVESTVSYSFAGAAFSWIYRKSVLMYVHAWLIAFGPVLFIIFIKYRESMQFLKENKLSAYYLLIIAFMGLAGGSDTERIVFWAMPVVYLMLVRIISENGKLFSSKLIIAIIDVTQIINMRVFWATPDYPNEFSSINPVLTPIGNQFPLLDLWTWHGDLKVNMISFAGYVGLFVILALVIKYNEKNVE